jgi:hypothetical protein
MCTAWRHYIIHSNCIGELLCCNDIARLVMTSLLFGTFRSWFTGGCVEWFSTLKMVLSDFVILRSPPVHLGILDQEHIHGIRLLYSLHDNTDMNIYINIQDWKFINFNIFTILSSTLLWPILASSHLTTLHHLKIKLSAHLGCQSGAVVRSMFEINISTGNSTLRGCGFDSRSNPFLMW